MPLDNFLVVEEMQLKKERFKESVVKIYWTL